MKYIVNVSKGYLYVQWNDEVFVEAKNKQDAERKVLKLAEQGEIVWTKSDHDDSDANYQIEEIVEDPND